MTKNGSPTTIRDETFNTLRSLGLTRIFANPGSTEVSLLTGLPSDFEFVLGLHEGAVVGIATGQALATGKPSLVIVHTTAGLGNAVGAIATARVNRAPLVIVVGQQDRRQLAMEPFLAGKLRSLAGEYPVSFTEPMSAQDVPSAIARAFHDATLMRGPALVVVPMDDWVQIGDTARVLPAAARVVAAVNAAEADLSEFASLIDAAEAPVIVAGAGNDTVEGWASLVGLAESIGAPVVQESFAARAGFPQDHPQFAGFLSSSRSTLRAQLAGFDLVLAVGAPVFRQYNYEPGDLVSPETTVLVITRDHAEAHRSPARVALIAEPGPAIAGIDALVQRTRPAPAVAARRVRPVPPGTGEPLRASHVMALLGDLLPRETILVEETPSTRPDLHDLIPARQPLGFVSAAMGGLGFGLPAAIGLRMGAPERPVIAILGDGSAMYSIQGLWSAVHYDVGALFVILHNGRYAVMDRLADRIAQGSAPWPAFDEIDFTALSRSLGCESEHVTGYDDLERILSEAVAGLATRNSPIVVVVDVEPEAAFAP